MRELVLRVCDVTHGEIYHFRDTTHIPAQGEVLKVERHKKPEVAFSTFEVIKVSHYFGIAKIHMVNVTVIKVMDDER